ncbi:MAG: hypothetical protein J3R72DRAFT_494960 [Linnemannia gamsii]|nr:MAG: hypothetical protein J3R72DRAFT_494960 [Linnemannia gamsii]
MTIAPALAAAAQDESMNDSAPSSGEQFPNTTSILLERGYSVTMDQRVLETPKRVDPKAFGIILERIHVYALNAGSLSITFTLGQKF